MAWAKDCVIVNKINRLNGKESRNLCPNKYFYDSSTLPLHGLNPVIVISF